MLAAKSGSAMAALVATMKLGGQIAALEAMAVDPMRHIALPRLVATAVACPILVSLGNVICLTSAWVVSVAQLGVESATYWEALASYVTVTDLLIGLLKGLVFGLLIGLASLAQGFRADPSPAGVGRAANYAVVLSTIACIVVNYLLTETFY
jgi:phospholipid/cholesterol/gamma-HCH transport system permease protein